MTEVRKEINNDINYLAGSGINRRFGTEGEVLAGLYIRNRLQEMGEVPVVETFFCSRETFQIFSLYYIEFFFVVLFLLFLPMVGAIYGGVVTMLYIFEVLGYVSISKFLNEFQSQNIFALIPNKNKVEKPKILVIHTNYDAGISHSLYSPAIAWIFPRMQDMTFLCMLALVLVGVWAGIRGIEPAGDEVLRSLILICGGYLCLYGLVVFLSSVGGEETRGANFNASGVAGALALVRYFSQNPLENTNVFFIFSGAHACWMAGLREALKKYKFPRDRTLFLNLEGIGCGKLHIVMEEHFVFSFGVDKKLREWLKNEMREFKLPEAKSLSYPTSSFLLLAHRYDSFTLTGLDENGMPSYKNQLEDKVLNIKDENIEKAVEFVKVLAEKWSKL